MRSTKSRIAAITALAATALAVGIVAGSGHDSPKTAEAAESGQTAKAIPSYSAALTRAQSDQEQAVQSRTPATDTRLVIAAGPEDVYVGRIPNKDAVCISVEQRATQYLSTTCGDAAAATSGRLFLIRSGTESNGYLVVGVTPTNSVSATVTGDRESTAGEARGGLFVVRLNEQPRSLTFDSADGSTVARLEVPRTAK